jgi:UrcA family protein
MNLVILLSSLAAFHAEPAPSHAMVIHVRDLNLHSMAGSAVAVQRINDAAKAFCAARAQHDIDVTVLRCRREMSHRAVERIGSAEVRALYMESPSGMLFADAG